MAQIVGKRDCFRQIFVQPQRTCDGAADRRHLDRMREARSQMVAGAVEKNLRFVFEAAERARMNNACTIALKFGAIGVTRLIVLPPARFARFLRDGRERSALPLLHLFARLPFCAHVFIRSVEEPSDFGQIRWTKVRFQLFVDYR